LQNKRLFRMVKLKLERVEGYLKWPLSEDPDLVAEWSGGVIFLGIKAKDCGRAIPVPAMTVGSD
jgi:hypothetical protein